MMKKILSILMLLVVSVIAHAQQDVTRFLGIPVDGTKSEMIRKLQAKGFRYDSANDCLKGKFNGADVSLFVGTNNNKVYRIAVFYENFVGETAIRIRFNRLVEQFKNNSKYLPLPGAALTIPDDEDISYEITVNDKIYVAHFFQLSASDQEEIRSLQSKYMEARLNNLMTDEMIHEYSSAYDRMSKKSVKILIGSKYGEYYIAMCYDNGYNQANGAD